MPHGEVVVLALARVGVTRDVVVRRRIEERRTAAREHFMGVALVRHVEDDLVLRRIEDVVQGDGRLDHAQIGADVAAVSAQFLQKRRADLVRQRFELLHRKSFHVLRSVDFLKIHLFYNDFKLKFPGRFPPCRSSGRSGSLPPERNGRILFSFISRLGEVRSCVRLRTRLGETLLSVCRRAAG